MLTPQEQARYARQIMLRPIGAAGQEALKKARVLLIGVGGLAASAALYLARAGVGTLGLCDGDIVELTNLQRQILFDEGDVGHEKVQVAARALRARNPHTTIETYPVYAEDDNIDRLMEPYDFVLDCTDGFEAKFRINDACVRQGKPFCHAGLSRLGGQLMTWVPGHHAPCYRCIFGEPPPPLPTCQQGALGAIVGLIGTLQALEGIKYIVGGGQILTGKLLVCDPWENDYRKVLLPPARAGCSACGAFA